MLKLIPNIIFLFCIFPFVHSQSYIDLSNKDVIECFKIYVENNFVDYKLNDSDKKNRINISNVVGYYSDAENTYYYKKNGFKERAIEGKINVYFNLHTELVEVVRAPDPFNNDQYNSRPETISYLKWYLEKESEFNCFFDQKKRRTIVRYDNLKKEIFNKAISDDSLAIQELSILDKHPKIESLIKIIKGYNVRNFLRTKNKKPKAQNLSEVVIIRDNNKQAKTPLQFTVNGEEYILDRNSKIKLLIPNNQQSLICVTNDTNNSCDLISSSSTFPKYFEVKLNKNGESNIAKINGNSSYFKTRLAYYEKREKRNKK